MVGDTGSTDRLAQLRVFSWGWKGEELLRAAGLFIDYHRSNGERGRREVRHKL